MLVGKYSGLLLGLLAAAAAGCKSSSSQTFVDITVQVDQALTLDKVSVVASATGKQDFTQSLTPSAVVHSSFQPTGLADGAPIRIEARGTKGAATVVFARADVLLRVGHHVAATLHLDAACANVACKETETCEQGQCIPIPPPAMGDGGAVDRPADGAGGGAGGMSGDGGTSVDGGGPGTGGTGGDGGTSVDGGGGTVGAGCPSDQHLCHGVCISKMSVMGCGDSCDPCPVPSGATPSCNGTSCDFACGGAAKKCGSKCVTGCCGDADCPMQAGKTGKCDTSTNTCNYDCAAGNKPCGAGMCIPNNACCAASDCTATCQTCSGPGGSCVAVKGADDTDSCAGTCDATGACRSKKGQTCGTTSAGCISGTTCSPDGICCDRACQGACEACDLATTLGTCTAVSGQPHTGHASCAGTNASCAGTCTGRTDGACTYPTNACGTPSCSGLSFQPAGTCNGGGCNFPAAQSCQYMCSTTGCTGQCTNNARQCSNNTPQLCVNNAWQNQVACTGGFTCSGGNCVCASPRTMCGSACADTSTDAANCGACGHGCLGGACTSGICQPIALGSPAATSAVSQISVAGGRVYVLYMNGKYAGGVISMDANTPSTSFTNDTSQTYTFVAAYSCMMNGKFYYFSPTGVGSCTMGNCDATVATVASFGQNEISIDRPGCDAANGEIVYQTTTTTDPTAIVIHRVSANGGTPRTMTTYVVDANAIWTEIGFSRNMLTDRLFFEFQSGSMSTFYTVSTTALNAQLTPLASYAGMAASTIIVANPSVALLQLQQGTSQRVASVPLPSGVPSGEPPTWMSELYSDGTADATYFWGATNSSSPVPADAVFRCPIGSACTNPAILYRNQQYAGPFAQDSSALYWTVLPSAGGIFKVMKAAK